MMSLALSTEQLHLQTYYVLLLTLNVTATLAIVAACLWCRKKAPKNELLGLEGMVKLKNPDEVVVVTTTIGNSESQVDLNASTTSNADSEKRASTAAHRSLPDIPVAETSGDDGSDLYETQVHFFSNAMHNLKKQTSISQHSSISQADDSPYSRVKNSPHDYAKVRSTEHPYAQLNAPSTSTGSTAAASNTSVIASNQLVVNNTGAIHRNSLHTDSVEDVNDSPAPPAEIPAASAIAGMVSASQDLPYMTPPITNQHFSGDSQDSSKGYTSISVREPLANILAAQPLPKNPQRLATLSRDVNDSHYATVSDDSDETYAAIEDPTARSIPNPTTLTTAEIYTSGSETYAQIQPMQSNAFVVSVEINNTTTTPPLAPQGSNSASSSASRHGRPLSDHATPMPAHVDGLRAQMHSRQASSSSNNSAGTSHVGSLGSPKPEKRQANSPLPPTPKSNQMHASSNSNLTSGRNSVISVIECGNTVGHEASCSTETSPQKKHKSLSPSKDIEGMYAKVMKKAKFSRNSPSSQDNSPILSRKHEHTSALGVNPLDVIAAELQEAQLRTRSNSYGAKDHGYETIPADDMRNAVTSGLENRKSDCYTHLLHKERQFEGGSLLGYINNAKPPIEPDDFPPSSFSSEKHYETISSAGHVSAQNNNDPGYETLLKPKQHCGDPDSAKKSSDYDPNYEVLKDPLQPSAVSDDGYAKVIEKKLQFANADADTDSTDGYSKVKGEECEDGALGGYSTIKEADANHNYASILETKGVELKHTVALDSESDHYARIAETRMTPPPTLPLALAPTPAKATVDEFDALSPRLPELPSITSPSSVNSSLLNNSSATNLSSAHTTTTGTISSRQTPSSSQYESLTGSETDPNYESVCYPTNNSLTNENPYERLQHDSSDTQLSSPGSLATPEECISAAPRKCAANGAPKGPQENPQSGNTAIDVVVDDYFQV